jgi:hypothetical protein
MDGYVCTAILINLQSSCSTSAAFTMSSTDDTLRRHHCTHESAHRESLSCHFIYLNDVNEVSTRLCTSSLSNSSLHSSHNVKGPPCRNLGHAIFGDLYTNQMAYIIRARVKHQPVVADVLDRMACVFFQRGEIGKNFDVIISDFGLRKLPKCLLCREISLTSL